LLLSQIELASFDTANAVGETGEAVGMEDEAIREIEVDTDVVERLLAGLVKEERLVDEDVLLNKLVVETEVLDELVDEEVRLVVLAVEVMILVELVEDDCAQANAARAAAVRMEGSNIRRMCGWQSLESTVKLRHVNAYICVHSTG